MASAQYSITLPSGSVLLVEVAEGDTRIILRERNGGWSQHLDTKTAIDTAHFIINAVENAKVNERARNAETARR